MPWKTTVLADWDEAGIADADVSKVIKLPPAVISAIHLRLSGTGGAGAVAVDALLATTKIKTDKGYIFDMVSADMLILARKLTGRKPTITNAAGAYSETNQSIYFGRYPKDTCLLLDIRNSNIRQLEVTFGTLIAATAFATGTVKLTVTIVEWIGALPMGYVGFLGSKDVETKATGTGKVTFDLFQSLLGTKLAALLVSVGTITTVRQCEITDKRGSVSFGKANFRDLLNVQNIEELNIDAVETLYAYWALYDKRDDNVPELPVLSMTDPILAIERGTTTTTSKLTQRDLYPA